MQCRAHAAQLGRQYPEIKEANADVLIILGDPLESAKKYSQSAAPAFPGSGGSAETGLSPAMDCKKR